MRKIGMFKAMGLCRQYPKMSEPERGALREGRLRELVAHARENSPYYRELYKGLPEDFSLHDLQPVNKRELMGRFDDWVTDREVRLADIERFMEDTDNIGRKFRDKYLIFTTSGSTGNPLVALCDPCSNNVMGAITAVRSFARGEDMKAFIKRGGKTIGVFATGGFYLGVSSVRARLLMLPWKKRQMAVTSALLPVDEIVRKLNDFQPAMLGGYPSNLELLIEKRRSGELNISPVLIMTGGEYLSDSLRSRLAEAFGCYVQTSYSCTEGGTVACECREGHFHVNDDWVLVEPVDKDNAPVPEGELSDKILLTNLYNYSQPFIRYEVTDRVIMHSERCKCGNPSPWLELEGRTDDVLHFTNDALNIPVAPLAVYATLKEVHTLRRFQLVSRPGNMLELRLEPAEGVDKAAAFNSAKAALLPFLASHGVGNVTLTLSPDEPRQDAGSGKFKHIISEKA